MLRKEELFQPWAMPERENVHIPHFKAPLLAISVEGKRKGLIAFAPYRLSLGVLEAGEHDLQILMYGNRYNGFGTLHNTNKYYTWWGRCPSVRQEKTGARVIS